MSWKDRIGCLDSCSLHVLRQLPVYRFSIGTIVPRINVKYFKEFPSKAQGVLLSFISISSSSSSYSTSIFIDGVGSTEMDQLP